MQLLENKLTSNQADKEQTIILDVSGMKCAGCVGAVERQLTQQNGVISASVNLATEVAVVACEIGIVDPQILAQKLTDSGFPSIPRLNSDNWHESRSKQQERQRQEISQSIQQLITATILIILSGIGHLGTWNIIQIPLINNIWFHWALATAALLLPGRSIIIDGWRGLIRNSPNMNTLIGLGAITAYTASFTALLFPQLGLECFFDEPVMLLAFIILGKTVEKQAKYQAASSLQKLLELQPPTAKLIKPDSQELPIEIPVDTVRVGEYLQVLPGEKIPVDGEIVTGKTTVDEAMLTGESVPVIKQIGEQVTAGTLNLSGAIILLATHTGGDTTLAQIVALVEDAQTRKAPIQKLADIVAGYFTYGVMSIASLTFLFWYYIGTKIWPDVLLNHHSVMTNMVHNTVSLSPFLLSLKLAIAVLVIACPCALGLATPTAILVGSGIGAEQGLLIKGGDVLEKLEKLDTVVFDKTGTLTTGHPLVSNYLSFTPEWQNNDILQIAATVESGAFHPIATAILSAAERADLPLLKATDFYTEPGLGVAAIINQQKVIVGNREWLAQQHINVDHEIVGKTTVYVGINEQLVGLIECQETLRNDAKITIEKLHEMGLRVIILTGDNQSAAQTIAAQLNIPAKDVFAQVRPASKASLIQSLQQDQNSIVCMIGDGINDAPAMAQADISISLKVGTDVSIATSQIVLMRDSLRDIINSIDLGKATFKTIRQNLIWAFGYNILGIPIAAGILLPNWGIVLNPATAGALMAFSSLSVVTNSLLLRKRIINS